MPLYKNIITFPFSTKFISLQLEAQECFGPKGNKVHLCSIMCIACSVRGMINKYWESMY